MPFSLLAAYPGFCKQDILYITWHLKILVEYLCTVAWVAVSA